MKTNNTYQPEDIEALLMSKKFEDLLPEEATFVLTHVDSKDEYNLMRNTLLAIKKTAENNETIQPKPQIKGELLALMEQRSRRGAGWFNLNGFWGFLFPTDVKFFQQPGFQFATLAALLVFGFMFGSRLLKENNNNLAVNTLPVQEKQTEGLKKEQIVENDVVVNANDEEPLVNDMSNLREVEKEISSNDDENLDKTEKKLNQQSNELFKVKEQQNVVDLAIQDKDLMVVDEEMEMEEEIVDVEKAEEIVAFDRNETKEKASELNQPITTGSVVSSTKGGINNTSSNYKDISGDVTAPESSNEGYTDDAYRSLAKNKRFKGKKKSVNTKANRKKEESSKLYLEVDGKDLDTRGDEILSGKDANINSQSLSKDDNLITLLHITL